MPSLRFIPGGGHPHRPAATAPDCPWPTVGLVLALLSPLCAAGQIIEHRPVLTWSLLTTAEYNDNLLFTSDTARLEVLTLQATPQLEIEQGRGTLTPLLLGLSAELDRTPSEPQYNRNLPSVSFTGRHEFPKSILSFNAGYARTTDNRREAPGLIEANQRSAGLHFTGPLGRKGVYNAGLAYGSTQYKGDLYSRQSVRTASLDVGRPLLAKVQLGVGFSQSWERIGALGADSSFLSLYLEDTYSPKTSLSIRVGANRHDTVYGTGAVHLGLDTAVNHRWTDKTLHSLTLSNLARTDLNGRDTQTFSLGYRITVAPRNFFFYYGTLRVESAAYSPDPRTLAFHPVEVRRQTYAAFEGGASYRLKAWFSVGCSIRLHHVQTDYDNLEFAPVDFLHRRAVQHVLRLSLNLRY